MLALVTNARDFAGPPAVAALIEAGARRLPLEAVHGIFGANDGTRGSI